MRRRRGPAVAAGAGLLRREREVGLLCVGPGGRGAAATLDGRVGAVAVDAGAARLGGVPRRLRAARRGERAPGEPRIAEVAGRVDGRRDHVALGARQRLPDGRVAQVEPVGAHGWLGGGGLAAQAGRRGRAVGAAVAGGAGERAVPAGEVGGAVHVLAAGHVDGPAGEDGGAVAAPAVGVLRVRGGRRPAVAGGAGLLGRQREVGLGGVGPDRRGAGAAVDGRAAAVAVDAAAAQLGLVPGGLAAAGHRQRAPGQQRRVEVARLDDPGRDHVALGAGERLPDGGVAQVEPVGADGGGGGGGLAAGAPRRRRVAVAAVAGEAVGLAVRERAGLVAARGGGQGRGQDEDGAARPVTPGGGHAEAIPLRVGVRP